MAYYDLTADFRTLVQDKKRTKPEPRSRNVPAKRRSPGQSVLGAKVFLTEAYNIVSNNLAGRRHAFQLLD